MPDIDGATVFDQKGHLIAREFGGPDIPENLVPMHALPNQWYEYREMEKAIGKNLKKYGRGTMTVECNYRGSSLRPESFTITCKFPNGPTLTKTIANYSGRVPLSTRYAR